jgi:hypothetical protein
MARTKKSKAGAGDRPSQPDPTAPLDGGKLLEAARPVLGLLREDLGKRAEDAGVERALRARYEAEKAAKRTGDSFGEWREGLLAQVAASWFLSCVFVRTLEDRGLLGQARIAGPGAADSQKMFDQLAPSLTERDYLLFVFRELTRLPAAKALFDASTRPCGCWPPRPRRPRSCCSSSAAPSRGPRPALWPGRHPRAGRPVPRPERERAQALCPAADARLRRGVHPGPHAGARHREVWPRRHDIIDPTCGSGHFCWAPSSACTTSSCASSRASVPPRRRRALALDKVYGADINPYAVAVARFRLTLAYLEKAGFSKLGDAPELPLHVVVADSLLHNPQLAQRSLRGPRWPSAETLGFGGRSFSWKTPRPRKR